MILLNISHLTPHFLWLQAFRSHGIENRFLSALANEEQVPINTWIRIFTYLYTLVTETSLWKVPAELLPSTVNGLGHHCQSWLSIERLQEAYHDHLGVCQSSLNRGQAVGVGSYDSLSHPQVKSNTMKSRCRMPAKRATAISHFTLFDFSFPAIPPEMDPSHNGVEHQRETKICLRQNHTLNCVKHFHTQRLPVERKRLINRNMHSCSTYQEYK